MLTVHLVRGISGADGTFGRLVLPSELQLISGELPWNNNERRRSCIPLGDYVCKFITSPRFGPTYAVTNVPNRSNILIHPANFVGLAEDGKKQELHGCIALGLNGGFINGQRVVLNSRVAVQRFEDELARKDFILRISNGQTP